MSLMAATDPSSFLLSEVQEVEGETILIGDCADHEAFCALPKVLSWGGMSFGLTGWNSDKGYACWKQSGYAHRLARKTGGRDAAKWNVDLLLIARELDAKSESPCCHGCGRERNEEHKKDCVLYPTI